MIHLIAQLSGWLVLTAAFAGLAGWAFAARQAAPEDDGLRRERENLVRDIVSLASGDSNGTTDDVGAEREIDAARRMGEIHIARIAELERALSAARANADSAAAQAAELQRLLEAREAEPVPAEIVEPSAPPEPSPSEEAVALQAWRLRYFEQRVRYLEEKPPHAAEPAAAPAPPIDVWRARVAAAEAAYLADEVRALAASAPEAEAHAEASIEESVSPFAANADVDVLLRWRMLYLERRVAHLQAQSVGAAAAARIAEPPALHPTGPDPDRWKWRARYLEARARHLEHRLAHMPPVAAPQAAAMEIEHEDDSVAPTPQSALAAARMKPAMLASPRHGAPDDLTLIEGVSQQQQSTFYSLGVFHFDQIAAWTPENVAWVDAYLRLRGRIGEEEWVEQAADLARDGPSAARRVLEEEEV